MTSRPAVAAAQLSLRLHPRTATLVVLVTTLTLAGALPALALVGATGAPRLTVQLPEATGLAREWGGGVAWTALQDEVLRRLAGLVRGGTALVLAIGIATVLALHVAHAGARHGDVIVARAVGASRRTIVRAAILEALALAVVACAVAFVLAGVAGAVLRSAWPGSVAAGLPWSVAAATLAVAATALAAPLLLARAVTTRRLVDDDRRPLTLLVPALQVGAALVVLAGGRTIARALERPLAAPIPALHVTTVADTGTDRLARAQRIAAVLARVHDRDPAALLAVTSPGALLGLGTSGDVMTDCGDCNTAGMPSRYKVVPAVHHAVSGDSFALAGIPLLAGRSFTAADRWDAPLVAVVSERIARDFFANGDALGRRIRLTLLGDRWFTVVGVVGETRPRTVGAAMQAPFAVYVSVLQHPPSRVDVATGATPVATATVAALGPVVARDALAVRAARLRAPLAWFARTLALQGVVALLIAIGGTLVLLRLWLDAQRRELGVMRAVGATRGTITRRLVGRAALVAVGGSAVGAWGGLIAWDVLPRLVPGAPPWDGRVVGESALVLSTGVLLAAWWTARRVGRTPPVLLLQADGD
jgi:hypothetical protein